VQLHLSDPLPPEFSNAKAARERAADELDQCNEVAGRLQRDVDAAQRALETATRRLSVAASHIITKLTEGVAHDRIPAEFMGRARQFRQRVMADELAWQPHVLRSIMSIQRRLRRKPTQRSRRDHRHRTRMAQHALPIQIEAGHRHDRARAHYGQRSYFGQLSCVERQLAARDVGTRHLRPESQTRLLERTGTVALMPR
jgi:hypothetical protein